MNRLTWLFRLLDAQPQWFTVAPLPDPDTGEVGFEAVLEDTGVRGYGVTSRSAAEDLAEKLMGATKRSEP